MQLKNLILIVLLALSITSSSSIWAQESLVSSERWPQVTVSTSEEFMLLGSTTIDLYEVARAEIHIFVEIENRVVRRLYWIQFEGYYEENDITYDYSEEPWRVEIDGLSFYAGSNAYEKENITEAIVGSDSHAVAQMVEGSGFSLPNEIIRSRLVHLDDARRNELMIIYMEDLELSGATLEDLETNNFEQSRLFELIRDRAVTGLDIQ